jgi:hypothetical protein
MMTLCINWRVVRYFQGEEKIIRPALHGLGILNGVHIIKPYDVFVKPRIFIENPNPYTIAIVPGSVAIAYRTSHR